MILILTNNLFASDNKALWESYNEVERKQYFKRVPQSGEDQWWGLSDGNLKNIIEGFMQDGRLSVRQDAKKAENLHYLGTQTQALISYSSYLENQRTMHVDEIAKLKQITAEKDSEINKMATFSVIEKNKVVEEKDTQIMGLKKEKKRKSEEATKELKDVNKKRKISDTKLDLIEGRFSDNLDNWNSVIGGTDFTEDQAVPTRIKNFSKQLKLYQSSTVKIKDILEQLRDTYMMIGIKTEIKNIQEGFARLQTSLKSIIDDAHRQGMVACVKMMNPSGHGEGFLPYNAQSYPLTPTLSPINKNSQLFITNSDTP